MLCNALLRVARLGHAADNVADNVANNVADNVAGMTFQ